MFSLIKQIKTCLDPANLFGYSQLVCIQFKTCLHPFLCIVCDPILPIGIKIFHHDEQIFLSIHFSCLFKSSNCQSSEEEFRISSQNVFSLSTAVWPPISSRHLLTSRSTQSWESWDLLEWWMTHLLQWKYVIEIIFLYFSNKCHQSIKRLIETIIIVVIITWPSEKPQQKNNSDITVIWVSDWFKWVMFMQNFEHGVTVSYMMSQLASNEIQGSVFCCFLFAVFK